MIKITTKPKPCPFCEEPGELRQVSNGWIVQCTGFFCPLSHAAWSYDTEEEAVASWNQMDSNDVYNLATAHFREIDRRASENNHGESEALKFAELGRLLDQVIMDGVEQEDE